jgi:transcriptional regulator with XRE-family HTH domain
MAKERVTHLKDTQAEMLERLWQYLDDHGMSQRQLAEKLGTRESTVSSWKQGRASPGGPLMQALPRVLGVNAEWLNYGKGHPFVADHRDDYYARGKLDGRMETVQELRDMLYAMERRYMNEERAALQRDDPSSEGNDPSH